MILFRLELAALILLLSFVNSFSQNSLLWEITGNGLKKPSYLFGTIHIKDKRVFDFGDSLMICFDSCKTLAGELALDSIDEDIIGSLMMPGDTTLKMLIGKKDYRLVKKKIRKQYGVIYTLVVNRIKPIYTATLLTDGGKTEKKEEMEVFLDLHLQNVAKEKNMKVTGLETVKEQLDAFEILSLKEQANLLVEQLKKPGSNEKGLMEQMINAYINQDLESMYQFFLDQEVPEAMMKSLLETRNLVMSERMEPLMQENSTFVAVGAAHLPGEQGLLNLLKIKGYKVRPVYCKK